MDNVRTSPLPPGVPARAQKLNIGGLVTPSCFWIHLCPEDRIALGFEELTELEHNLNILFNDKNLKNNYCPAVGEVSSYTFFILFLFI